MSFERAYVNCGVCSRINNYCEGILGERDKARNEAMKALEEQRTFDIAMHSLIDENSELLRVHKVGIETVEEALVGCKECDYTGVQIQKIIDKG